MSHLSAVKGVGLRLVAAVTIGASSLMGVGATAASKPDSQRFGDVELIRDLPECGGDGLTGHRLASGRLYCTHSAADFGSGMERLARSGEPAVLPVGAKPHAKSPRCYGDGSSGKRVHLIYAYAENTPSRSGTVVPIIKNTYAPNMEGLVRAESARTGKELGIRFFHDSSCTARVSTVKLPADAGNVNGGQFGRINNYLEARGYNRSDRKYLVFWDGNGAACGIGTLFPLEDTPGPNNLHNGYIGQQSALALNMAHSYAPCWGMGPSGATVELHELFHTLGAVQYSSPRSNQMGHCTDEEDVMCYSEGGVMTRTECFTSYEQLDCNKNDYFNTNPPASSYLATHWNTANSRFLGEFATDAVGTLPDGLESP